MVGRSAAATHRLLLEARPFFVIAGPCLVESAEHCVAMASRLKAIGEALQLPMVFKASFDKANRRRAGAPRGSGLDAGLAALQAVKDETGLAVTTDVHEVWQVERVAQVADVLQVPALLCRQTDLLEAAACTGRLVNIKKGQFASAAVMADAAQKVRLAAAAAAHPDADARSGDMYGSGSVILTERGNAFGYADLVVDPLNLVRMRSDGRGSNGGAAGNAATTMVVQDVTHSVQQQLDFTAVGQRDPCAAGGTRAHIAPIARMAAAVGVHGFFIETHERPAEALCDAATAFPLDDLEPLLRELRDIANASRGMQHSAIDAASA